MMNDILTRTQKKYKFVSELNIGDRFNVHIKHPKTMRKRKCECVVFSTEDDVNNKNMMKITVQVPVFGFFTTVYYRNDEMITLVS